MRTWHRETGVRVFVLDEQQRILLVRMEERQTGDSYWVLPGGGIEDGEQAVDAAVREVQEETGITVSIDRLVYLLDSVETQVPQLCYTFFFLAQPVQGATPIVGFDPERPADQQVLSGSHFFSRDELAALPRLYPTVLRHEFWTLLEQGFLNHNPYRVWSKGASF